MQGTSNINRALCRKQVNDKFKGKDNVNCNASKDLQGNRVAAKGHAGQGSGPRQACLEHQARLIPLPEDCVLTASVRSRLAGEGGENFKYISQQTGVRVAFYPTWCQADETPQIRIVADGNQADVEEAAQLVNDLIESVLGRSPSSVAKSKQNGKKKGEGDVILKAQANIENNITGGPEIHRSRWTHDDLCSTRASSPCSANRVDLAHALTAFDQSELDAKLHTLQHALESVAKDNGLPGISHSDLILCLDNVVSEYNKITPGWEIPVRAQCLGKNDAARKPCKGQKDIAAQCGGDDSASETDSVPQQSWAARLKQTISAVAVIQRPKQNIWTTRPSSTVVAKGNKRNADHRPRNMTEHWRTPHTQYTVASDVKPVPMQDHQTREKKTSLQAAPLQPAAQPNELSKTAMSQKKVPQTPGVKSNAASTTKTHTGTRFTFTKKKSSQHKTDPACWPALRTGEIEFMLDDPLSFLPTRSICSPSSITVGRFRFKILLFPRGTHAASDKYLSAFVLAEPGDVEPDCVFKNVKFEITLVNWKDFAQNLVKSENYSFTASGHGIDRGWHDLLRVGEMTTSDSEWVGPRGSVCIRARCEVQSPSEGWSNDR